ncbi:hypothetical protein C7D71_30780, partial [Klebsiella pneumoniae]
QNAAVTSGDTQKSLRELNGQASRIDGFARPARKAVDQATRPFKSIQDSEQNAAVTSGDTQKSLRELNGQASRIDGFARPAR